MTLESSQAGESLLSGKLPGVITQEVLFSLSRSSLLAPPWAEGLSFFDSTFSLCAAGFVQHQTVRLSTSGAHRVLGKGSP